MRARSVRACACTAKLASMAGTCTHTMVSLHLIDRPWFPTQTLFGRDAVRMHGCDCRVFICHEYCWTGFTLLTFVWRQSAVRQRLVFDLKGWGRCMWLGASWGHNIKGFCFWTVTQLRHWWSWPQTAPSGRETLRMKDFGKRLCSLLLNAKGIVWAPGLCASRGWQISPYPITVVFSNGVTCWIAARLRKSGAVLRSVPGC